MPLEFPGHLDWLHHEVNRGLALVLRPRFLVGEGTEKAMLDKLGLLELDHCKP